MEIAIILLIVAAMFAGMWGMFAKAGQPGWAAIVPVYNVYVLTIEIAKKEIMWFIFFLIPILNLAAAVVVYIEVAKKFGKEAAYGIGMLFLPFVFFPMLGFGSAEYEGGGKKRPLYDLDDDDDRPRKKKPKDDDEEEEEEDDRPRKKKPRDDD